MAVSTVSGILTRIGMGKLGRLGLEPANRYERSGRASWSTSTSRSSAGSGGAASASPGARRHNPRVERRRTPPDVGWEYVHIAIDDCTRLAYTEVLDDEKAMTVVGFLRRAVAFYAATGSASSSC